MTHQPKTAPAMARRPTRWAAIVRSAALAVSADVQAAHSLYKVRERRRRWSAKLNTSLHVVLNGKLTKDKLAELSIKPAGGTLEEAMAFATQEAAKWKKVIEDAGIKAD